MMLANRGRGKIRPPRRGLGNDSIDFDQQWAILSSSLREIHTKNQSKLSFEELYRNAYKLVLKNKGGDLYDQVKDFEESWLAKEIRPRILSILSSSLLVDDVGTTGITTVNEKRTAGERLLRALKEAWEDHNLCMNMTTDVLMYMDRVYCTDNRKPSIFTASMGQFRDHVLLTPIPGHDGLTIGRVLFRVVLDQIRMEREGDIINKALIRSCMYMLEGLYENDDEEETTKLYLTIFEPEFLTASAHFYRSEGVTLLREADASSFCRQVKRRTTEEQDRCRSTLSPLTSSKIKVVLDNELIKPNLPAIVALDGSGMRSMLDNDRLSDLESIYDLNARVDPKKEEVQREMQKRVSELGIEINNAALNSATGKSSRPDGEQVNGDGKTPAEKPGNLQTATAIKWVDDLLQLKEKYDTILNTAFHSDQGIQTALSRTFTTFINEFDRSSENLSLFFDENMKKGIKGKTENEVDALLDKGITLLRYIQDKDMFERYYKKHLAKRLLMKRSVSMDAERQMISKMKLEVGNTFTQKIEAMFKDIAMSEDYTAKYKRHVAGLGDPDPSRAELDVNVLTTNMWPYEMMASAGGDDENQRPCIYPTQINKMIHGFQNYYHSKHNGRKLTWYPNMGTADLRACFPKSKGNIKTRELNVSTYAMIILLLFQDLSAHKSLSCEEIQSMTNIPLNELTRNLQSLAVAPKTRVLVKEPMSKDIKITDHFSFNESFYSQFQKVKIGVVSSGNKVEDVEERKETEKKNDDQRGGAIEAAIVRIMKQRKELTHQKLITEVIQQLTARFMPDINMVKKRIESLIEREYLERVENVERPAYRYMA